MKLKLDEFVDELVVLGFNSSRYDMAIVRKDVFAQLFKQESISYVIKKSSAQYACVKTPSLKFVDVCSYLAAGSSYAEFLKAYGAPIEKAHFLTRILIVSRN